MNTLLEYKNKNLVILPCKNKSPRLKDWDKVKETRVEDFYPNDNFGLHLLDNTDLDFDNPITFLYRNDFMKPSSAVYGRKSNPGSHWLYKGKATHIKFAIPEQFQVYFSDFPHKATLLEVRHGEGKQSIVPGSIVEGEEVKWEVFDNISIYDGNINEDASKLALATALHILFPTSAINDYCFAIACILAEDTKWTDSEIDQFVKNIADRNNKNAKGSVSFMGTHAREVIQKNQRRKKFSTLAKIIGVDDHTGLHTLFSWVGVQPPSEALNKLVDEYVYFEDTGEMFSPKTKGVWKRQEFNNKHLFEIPKVPYAFNGLLLHPDFQCKKVMGRAFLPTHEYPIATIHKGQHPLLEPGKYYNDYEGSDLEAVKGDVSVFRKTYIDIFGEEDWELVEQFIAFMVQNPGVKIKWGLLIVSQEGIGKGLLMRALSRIFGYRYVNENVTWDDMTDKHSVSPVGQLLICLNEVVITGKHAEKMTISSGLKGFWADDFLNINDKNKRPYKYLNNCNGMMFSNNKDCVHLDSSSRRYAVIHVDKTIPWIEKYSADGNFDRLVDFIESDDGASAILYHFKYEVTVKEPKLYKSRAPKTKALEVTQGLSKHGAISKLQRAFDDKLAPFNDDFVGMCSLDDLMVFMQKEWHISYPPEQLVLDFLRENCFLWRNGKKTRQIVMAKGERPHMWLLCDSDRLRDLTPIQLGECSQMDPYEYRKKLGMFSVADPEFRLEGPVTPDVWQVTSWFRRLQFEGFTYVENLMLEYCKRNKELEKLKVKYSYKDKIVWNTYNTGSGMNAKTMNVIKYKWDELFKDPEYLKIEKSFRVKSDEVAQEEIKGLPSEVLWKDSSPPIVTGDVEGNQYDTFKGVEEADEK